MHQYTHMSSASCHAVIIQSQQLPASHRKTILIIIIVDATVSVAAYGHFRPYSGSRIEAVPPLHVTNSTLLCYDVTHTVAARPTC